MKKFLCIISLFLLSTSTFCKYNSNISVETLTKSTHSWNGDTLPSYPEGQPEITILKIVIPPNTKLPMHNHPVINAGVLISGELTVETEDKKLLYLKAGDPIVEVTKVWHFGKNETNQPAEIIVFYAGVKNKPVTVKK